MGLFDKKFCDICGEKIGLLGNRKLDDGNMCSNCAKNLSPFFSERRQSTIADINNQLAYREANKPAVAAFNVTRTFGKNTRVLLDDNARKMIVTSSNKWQNENPDVIDYSQISGCSFNVDSTRKEETYQKDGRTTSYVPPRYIDVYDFYITIYVNSPWFNEIRFKINSSSVQGSAISGGGILGEVLNTVTKSMEFKNYEAQGQEIKNAIDGLITGYGGGAGYAGGAPGQPAPYPAQAGAYAPQAAPGAAWQQGQMGQPVQAVQPIYPVPAGQQPQGQQAYAAPQGQPAQYQQAQGYPAPQAQPPYPPQQGYPAPQAQPQPGYATYAAAGAAMICPHCRASVVPLANGTCEYCRGLLR